MTSKSKILYGITNKTRAFEYINEQQDWHPRMKAQYRFQWRKRHEPEKIARCPAKGKRQPIKPWTTEDEEYYQDWSKNFPNVDSDLLELERKRREYWIKKSIQ